MNYDVLGQSATSLRSIRTEFELTHQFKENLVGHLGSENIADAMGEFSDNWDRKRNALLEKIKATEKVVQTVMASFSEQDRNAAQFDLSDRTAPMKSTSKTAP